MTVLELSLSQFQEVNFYGPSVGENDEVSRRAGFGGQDPPPPAAAVIDLESFEQERL